MRAADLLVRTLSDAGVEKIFSLSGNQIMSVYDALIGSGIDLIHVRHEAAAVHMADAWGRLAGAPGVALVTAGPGFANALSAMYVAQVSESPVVVLSGNARLRELGRGAMQEMPQSDMAGPVTKESWTATEASNLGHDLARAFRIATSGRPGPVHIALPEDLLIAEVVDGGAASPGPDDFRTADQGLDDAVAGRILDALTGALRPLILGGPAMTRGAASETLRALSDTTGVPAVASDSPRGINDPSLGAFAEVLAEADVVLLLGKRLDFTLSFGKAPELNPDCAFLQVDAEPRVLEQTERNLGRPARLAVAAVAGPVEAADRMIELAEGQGRSNSGWAAEVEAAIAFRPPEWSEISSPPRSPIHGIEVAHAVQQVLDGRPDSVYIADGGEFGQWVQAGLSAPVRLLNGPAGAIGAGIPFALAARLAYPDSAIVTHVGDGTFGFHAMEFDTAVRYDLPFVAVVGNDAAWNAEYQLQLREFGEDRVSETELLPTRYDRVAESLGGHGEHVTSAKELRPAIERAIASGRPACVNVALARVPAPRVRRRSTATDHGSAAR